MYWRLSPARVLSFGAPVYWRFLFQGNIFRIVVVMACLGLICGGGYMVWRIWKDRYRHPRYLGENLPVRGHQKVTSHKFHGFLAPLAPCHT